jgi:hypothetical protein
MFLVSQEFSASVFPSEFAACFDFSLRALRLCGEIPGGKLERAVSP